MIKLEQYKETLHKCSKCGLCQEVCPMYHQNGNECATARGIIILLRGIINKEVSFKKNTHKYLDLCLKCGKCSQVCPSEIPIEDIIFATKRKWLYSSLSGLIKRIQQSALTKKWFTRKRKFVSKKFERKAVYIGGNFLAVAKLLNKNKIEILNNLEFSWGWEYLHSGNIIRFHKNFKSLVAELIRLKPDFVVIDIPPENFKNIIKVYTNSEFKIKLIYLGDFSEANTLVCKFYNPMYADDILLKSITTKDNQ